MSSNVLRAGVLVLVGLGCRYDGGGTSLAEPAPAPARKPDAGRSSSPPRTTSIDPPPPDAQVADAIAAADTGGAPSAASDAGASGPPEAGAPPAADAGGTVSPPDTAPASVEASSATCPKDSNLAVCLSFDDRLADESPHRLPVDGRGVRFVPGKTGMAAAFAGQARITVPEANVLDAATITVEADVNPRALGRRMAVIDNPGQYGLYILGSGSVMCSGRGGYVLRNGTVSPGRWTHLLCTFDSSSITLWVDGERAGTRPAGPVATGGEMGLHVGWEVDPPNNFDGLIDNVRVWRVLRRQ